MRPAGIRQAIMATVLGCCLAVLSPAATITRVQIETIGDRPLDEAYIRAHLEVAPGEELDRIAVNRDVKALVETGRFTDVQAVVLPGADGVVLVYRIAQRLRLAEPVAIKGNEELRTGKIRKLLELSVDDYIDDGIIGTGVQRVLQEYRKDFRPDAKITWVTVPDPAYGRDARVTLTVEEGKRSRVSELRFVGNAAIPSKELRNVLKRFTWYNPFSWFRRLRYEADLLEEARQEMVRMYRERGHLNAEVLPPGVERDADGQVVLTFTIREGQAYRVGEVRIEGSGTGVFPLPTLVEQIKAPAGATAAQSLIESNRQALRDYFGARGYIDTLVTVREFPDPARGVADLVYTVREGPQANIRNILIRGNTRTRDKVIRRELLVYPGEIYDEVKVRRSERIISNLGFFGRVRAEPVDTAVEGEKDLLLTVEEQRSGQFMVGAGFSSVDNVIGFMEISQGNFDIAGWPSLTGGGQKLRLRAQVGGNSSNYELSFVEPWFLDRRLSLGVDLFRREYRYSEYDLIRTGGAVSLGRALFGPSRITAQYQLEFTEITDIGDTNMFTYAEEPFDPFYFTDEEDNVISSMRLTYRYDTRNNAFIPTRGTRVIAFSELAGGPFGFDVDLYRLGANSTTYIPLFWGHVLNLRSRAEVVEAYGDADSVPITERLFLGGGRTLRGFDYREVGPKVFRVDDGALEVEPVGGQSLALAGAEYLIPLFSKVRLATFYDIGNVWRESYVFEPGNLASSWGIGLRLDFPGFPIRIDRAWALEKDSDLTGEDAWVFWIGFE